MSGGVVAPADKWRDGTTAPDCAGRNVVHVSGRGIKADTSARQELGEIYDAVPKSAFALMAYHLANLCCDDPDTQPGIFARLQEEADALVANGIMPERHAEALRAAIAKATQP